MGLALLIVVLKSLAIWKKDEMYQQSTRFWVKLFAISFVMGVVTGIPLEFQFGTNWAAFFAIRWQHHRPNPGDGRRVRLFPGICLPWGIALWRATARSALALGRRGDGLPRHVGLWVFHYRQQCLAAEPGRLRDAPRGTRYCRLPGDPLQSVDVAAIPPHHVRCGHHRLVRDGRPRRLLHAPEPTRAITRRCSSSSV